MLEMGTDRQAGSGMGSRRTIVRRVGTRAAGIRVAVLPATVLGLELLLETRALDLRAASALLREDPGALLHMFRLLAEECPEVESRPERLEECLASLSIERLLRRLTKASVEGGKPRRLEGFARHAAEIGRGAESVAESLGLVREQAWTVGMLHELGCLPGLSRRPEETDRAGRCAELARRYRLPTGVCEALDEVHREVPGSVWRAVVAAAHELETAT